MRTFTDDTELEKHTGIKLEHLKKILGLLKELFPELQRVILYGSRARGEFSQGADIDLALDCGEKIENPRRLQEAADVLNVLRSIYKCDTVDYSQAKDLFLGLINQDGIIVWNK